MIDAGMHALAQTQPIYLTFDDGPDLEWTPRILDVLAQARAHATFFVVGEQLRRTPALARRALAEGHVVGNHTFSHRHPWFMAEPTARAQVRDGAAAVSDAVGLPAAFFRPPHGRRRPCMTDEARQLGERVILWDRTALDWGPLGMASGIEQRLSRVRARDIVLMHDGRRRSNRPEELLRVLPAFLASLAGRGLHTARLL